MSVWCVDSLCSLQDVYDGVSVLGSKYSMDVDWMEDTADATVIILVHTCPWLFLLPVFFSFFSPLVVCVFFVSFLDVETL